MSRRFPALLSEMGETESHSHDFSQGEIRAAGGHLGSLLIAGDLTLGPGGVIRTAASGRRVELTNEYYHQIRLWGGAGTVGELPAIVEAHPTGAVRIESPSDAAHPTTSMLYLRWGTGLGLQAGWMYGHFHPIDDNSFDLGSATETWRAVYAYGIYDEGGNLRLDLSTLSYGADDSGGAGFKLIRVPN